MHIFQSHYIRNPKYLWVSGGICEFLLASSVEALILARDRGQSHLPSSEFRFSDKFLGMEINSTDMTTTLPQEKKKGSGSKTVSISSEEVISFDTGIDST